MEDIRFFIPTRGRIGRQLTVQSLPETVHPLITIVCPREEVDAHRAEFPLVTVVAQPDDVVTIGTKRKWIFEEVASLVRFAWQMDDDLSFKILVDGLFKTSKSYPIAVDYVLRTYLLGLHNVYDVVGIGTSYFAPRGGVRENYHLGFAFGLGIDARVHMELGRLDVFEDIDYTLQCLRSGRRIAVTYEMTVDQKLPDAPGGVTGERTLETIDRDLDKLISFHPGIVSRKPRREGAHPAAITKVLWAKAAKEGGL